jgi:hypothetical protein
MLQESTRHLPVFEPPDIMMFQHNRVTGFVPETRIVFGFSAPKLGRAM